MSTEWITVVLISMKWAIKPFFLAYLNQKDVVLSNCLNCIYSSSRVVSLNFDRRRTDFVCRIIFHAWRICSTLKHRSRVGIIISLSWGRCWLSKAIWWAYTGISLSSVDLSGWVICFESLLFLNQETSFFTVESAKFQLNCFDFSHLLP